MVVVGFCYFAVCVARWLFAGCCSLVGFGCFDSMWLVFVVVIVRLLVVLLPDCSCIAGCSQFVCELLVGCLLVVNG